MIRTEIRVRNSSGVISPFSVDRFARNAAAGLMQLDEARALARKLLGDINHSGRTLITTDDIRHWVAERDPLVLVSRARLLDERGKPIRGGDPTLAAILDLARTKDDSLTILVADSLIDYFRPGAGQLLQQMSEPEDRPPLDDLEKAFGEEATLLTPKEADFKKTGHAGPDQQHKEIPQNDKDLYEHFYVEDPEKKQKRLILKKAPEIECGKEFFIRTTGWFAAPKCQNPQYAKWFRETLLYSLAEAARICSTKVPRCPRAKVELRRASWQCGSDVASIILTLKVVCSAN